ncbi:MAG: DUF4147 domain-containing protein [Pseudomonadota bacterium]
MGSMPRILSHIYREAVADVEPASLLPPHFGAVHAHCQGRTPLLLAVGKAALPMARGLVNLVAEVVYGSAVYTPSATAPAPTGCVVLEVGHPLPTPGSVTAARHARRVLAQTPDDTPVLIALSGGASAAWCDPVDGLSLPDLVATQQLLARRGADITQINTVRRHLSQIQGGRLALAARPRPVLCLALVDVVGGGPHDVGSGPAVGDPTSYRDAVETIETLDLGAEVPRPVITHLHNGLRGAFEENPRPGDSRLDHVHWMALATPALLRDRAARRAREHALHVEAEATLVTGSIQALVEDLVGWAQRAPANLLRVQAGEFTVELPTHPGHGGRARHLALAVAARLRHLERPWCMLAAGSDGVDGRGLVAGAVLDECTLRDVDDDAVAQALRDADSGPLLASVGAEIVSGPTGTNLCDLMLLWVGEASRPCT